MGKMHKMITLKPEIWALASKKENFSEWVADQLLNEKPEITNKPNVEIVNAYDLIRKDLEDARKAWEEIKEKDSDLARMVYDQSKNVFADPQPLFHLSAKRMKWCVARFYELVKESGLKVS